MSKHPEEALSAYLDGELSIPEQKDLVEHLAGCESCRQVLEDVAFARSALRSLPTIELPPGLIGVAPRNVIPIRHHRVAWASAAAAAALIAGVTYASLSTPSHLELTPGQLGEVWGAVSEDGVIEIPTRIVVPPIEETP